MKNIVVLGGARDYHAMDWYRTIKKLSIGRKVTMLTDLIDSEGYDVIINKNDRIEKLFIIDRFLFSKQSRIGNIWRNILKLLVLPIQIIYLKIYSKKNPNSVYHAHPMYYMFLCWLSNIEFIGSPQGSEILVRPKRSRLYSYFATKTLQAAKYVTVDSVNMKNEIFELSGAEAIIIQYGIDTDSLLKINNLNHKKNKVVSLRGITELYRIKEIVFARNNSKSKVPIEFIYPFGDESYKNTLKEYFDDRDIDIGRLDKDKMYDLLSKSILVISIPKSDSSPRSVYEAIFLGCCVAVTYNPWIEVLPECMKKRLFIVDLNNSKWFDEAIDYAQNISKLKYIPSEEALELFDQDRSMQKAIKVLY